MMIRRILIGCAAVFALSTAAFAEDKLTTFDLTKPITQLDGKPFKIADDITDAEKPVVMGLLARGYTVGKPDEKTVATVSEDALLAEFRDEPADINEKRKRFNLATAISQNPSKVIMNAAQVAMLEKLVAKAYNPLVLGQVLKVIDPNSLND